LLTKHQNVNLSGSGNDPVKGFCEHDNQFLIFEENGDILDQMNQYPSAHAVNYIHTARQKQVVAVIILRTITKAAP
jgi:hypothetical protein